MTPDDMMELEDRVDDLQAEVGELQTEIDELRRERNVLLSSLRNLYVVLRDRHHGRMPEEVQIHYDNARQVIIEMEGRKA